MSNGLSIIEPARVAGGLGGKLLDSARYFVDSDKDIVAYAITGMYADGCPFVMTRCDWPETMPLNRHLFIGMSAELIRDSMITERTACEVVNRSNGYDD
jgi:hypothetical protein